MAGKSIVQRGNGQFSLAGIIVGMETMNNARTFFYVTGRLVQATVQRRGFDALRRQRRAGRNNFKRQ
ncbi:hypothetical protein D3C72_2427010 [compost metagenome]